LLSPDRVILVVNRQRPVGVPPMLGRCSQLLCAGLPPVRRLPHRCAHGGTLRPRGHRALPERAAWRAGGHQVVRCRRSGGSPVQAWCGAVVSHLSS